MISKDNRTGDAAELRKRAEKIARVNTTLSPEKIKALSPEEIQQMIHDLQIYQIELEMQNDELQRSQAKLVTAREHYFNLYDLAPVGYFTISEKGLILEANLSAATLLGVVRSELVNQPISRFIHKEDQNVYYLHRKRFFETGEPKMCELKMVKNDGTPFWVHLTETTAQEDDPPVFRIVLSDVTERKRIEEKLRASEAKYRTLIENLPLKIFIKDRKFTYVSCNENFARDLGITQGEFEGKTDYVFFPKELADKYRADDHRIMASGVTEIIEEQYNNKDGEIFWVQTIKTPVRDDMGNVTGILGVFIDITGRKQTEESLRAQEARYSCLIDAVGQSNIGLFLVGADYRVRFMNPPLVAAFGDQTGRICFEGMGMASSPCGYCKLDEVIHQQKIVHYQPTLANGKTYDIVAVPFQDTDGTLCKLEIIQDITKRRHSEQMVITRMRLNDFALSHSIDELRQKALDDIELLTGSQIGFFHDVAADQHTLSLQSWSTATLQNMCKAEGKGCHYDIEAAGVWIDCIRQRRPVIHNDYASLPHRKGLPEGHAPIIRELLVPVFRRDSIVAVLGVGNKRQDYVKDDIEIVSLLADLTYDIIERKQAEVALVLSEQRHRRFYESGLLGVFYWNLRGQITEANDKFLEMVGYTRDDLSAGRIDWVNMTPPEFRYLDDRAVIELKESGVNKKPFEKEYIRKDGTTRVPIILAGAMLDDERNNGVAFVMDITERRMLENRYRQSQKMEAIGTLAGGIAHDFNNILTSVIGYTELALDCAEKESPLTVFLPNVVEAGNRAKELVKQILTFARQSDEEFKPAQVDAIAKEALKFIRSSIPTTIEIRQHIESTSLVTCNPTQIHQIFMNLCTNATHAMEDNGGVLEVGMVDVEINGISPQTFLNLNPGNYLKITISDTGTGIAPEIINSIFDPYFTTKGPGEGTGMGLAMVHGIVQKSGGEIFVESEYGKGTVFSIYLPVIQKHTDHRSYDAEVLPSGNEHILVVDDEFPIVDIYRQYLEKLGYSVTIRTSSIETLALFRSKPDGFDLVITDMTMPNMTGDKLAVELMKIRPDIPVILCTGYSRKISKETVAGIGIKALAYKPVVRADLAITVRKVLDESKGSTQQ